MGVVVAQGGSSALRILVPLLESQLSMTHLFKRKFSGVVCGFDDDWPRKAAGLMYRPGRQIHRQNTGLQIINGSVRKMAFAGAQRVDRAALS